MECCMNECLEVKPCAFYFSKAEEVAIVIIYTH